MSWFKRNKGIDKTDDLDLSACFDSFNKHWQQTFEIIDRFQVSITFLFLCNLILNELGRLPYNFYILVFNLVYFVAKDVPVIDNCIYLQTFLYDL